MAIFALIFEEWECGVVKGAVLDFSLALIYLALTIACDVLLLDSGLYSFSDYTSIYRGAVWSAAIVWIIVSTVRLWFYASKPIHARNCLFEGSCQSMRSFVKNIFSNPTRSKKPIYFVSLLVLVMFTCLPTIFSSLMADEVLCKECHFISFSVAEKVIYMQGLQQTTPRPEEQATCFHHHSTVVLSFFQ